MTHLEETQLVEALLGTNPDPGAMQAVANYLRLASHDLGKLDWGESRLGILESVAFALLTAAKSSHPQGGIPPSKD